MQSRQTIHWVSTDEWMGESRCSFRLCILFWLLIFALWILSLHVLRSLCLNDGQTFVVRLLFILNMTVQCQFRFWSATGIKRRSAKYTLSNVCEMHGYFILLSFLNPFLPNLPVGLSGTAHHNHIHIYKNGIMECKEFAKKIHSNKLEQKNIILQIFVWFFFFA